MKRSEMEQYIELILENELGSSWNGYSTLAAYLLLKLEEKGMQPPKVKVEEVRKAISPEGEDGTFVSWTYKSVWEPEDENSQPNKLMPTPLTPDELADVYANDEELKDNKGTPNENKN